jgi:hypothetical protein
MSLASVKPSGCRLCPYRPQAFKMWTAAALASLGSGSARASCNTSKALEVMPRKRSTCPAQITARRWFSSAIKAGFWLRHVLTVCLVTPTASAMLWSVAPVRIKFIACSCSGLMSAFVIFCLFLWLVSIGKPYQFHNLAPVACKVVGLSYAHFAGHK